MGFYSISIDKWNVWIEIIISLSGALFSFYYVYLAITYINLEKFKNVTNFLISFSLRIVKRPQWNSILKFAIFVEYINSHNFFFHFKNIRFLYTYFSLIMWVFIFQNYDKIWRVSLGHFIYHKPLNFWIVTFLLSHICEITSGAQIWLIYYHILHHSTLIYFVFALNK